MWCIGRCTYMEPYCIFVAYRTYCLELAYIMHIVYMLHTYCIFHIVHILHIVHICLHSAYVCINAYLACITYVAYRCILCQYCYFVLQQEQEKWGALEVAGVERAAAGRAGLRAYPGGGLPGRCPRVAKPWWISTSLLEIKIVHEPQGLLW